MEAVERSCQDIINCISQSSLNYSVNLTPFSIYITVRKSLSNSRNAPVTNNSMNIGQNDCRIGEQQEVVKQSNPLTEQIRELENENLCLRNSLDEALADIESKSEEMKIFKLKTSDMETRKEAAGTEIRKLNENIVQQIKVEKSEHEEEKKTVIKENKELRKVVKESEKEIYNLRKEIKTESDSFIDLKVKFEELSRTFNSEKKQQERKLRKQDKKESIDKLKSDAVKCQLKCEECGFVVDSDVNLKFHMRSIHMSSIQTQTLDMMVKETGTQGCTADFHSDKIVQTEEPKQIESFVKYPCN